MSTCPYCGGSTSDGKHHLAEIEFNMVDGKIMEQEIWKCDKNEMKFGGNLDDSASEDIQQEYRSKKKLKYGVYIIELQKRLGQSVNSNQYMDIGDAYSQLGNYKLALNSYDKALEVDPNNFECNYRKGNIYLKQYKPDLAKREFERAARKGHKGAQEALNRENQERY